MSVFLGAIAGFILGVILGFCFSINHITRIIGAIVGAAHYYFVHRLGVEIGIYFIDAIIFGLSVLDICAAFFVIYEVGCLIGFVLELLGFDIDTSGGSSHTPIQSTFMGELVGMLSSLFR